MMAIRSPAVALLSLDFIVAPPIPGEPFIQKSPEPSAPTRSPTTDSIRAKLIPGDSDDFRRSYSRWLSPTPRGRPLRIQTKPRRMPEAYLSPPTYLAIPRRRRRDVGHFRRVIDAAPRLPE